jgi:hypothetical protein
MIRPVRLNPQSLENPSGVAVAGILLAVAAAGGAAWYFTQGSGSKATGRGEGVDEKIDADRANPQQIFADGSPTKRITRAEAQELIKAGPWHWANSLQTAITDKPIEEHKFAIGRGKNVRAKQKA